MADIFRDRIHAGRLLAEKLLQAIGVQLNMMVLGIPRGGVVTARSVADQVNAPLSVIVSRKLRAPYNPELGIGAVSEHDALYVNWELVHELGITEDYLKKEVEYQKKRVQEYVLKFRGGAPLSLKGSTAVIVDDGVATGATVIAAAIAARNAGASKVVVATPVIAEDVAGLVARYCDQLVWVLRPRILYAVGMYYEDFSEVTDEEVLSLLRSSTPQ
ncbi:phosphoribosyltransferase [Infirmifilum lucidum]|uniref:Phosphoribosyltransferase n=1 Tax=Infirmifilum lucidum TaxID=2776706 RepID=A0A7L9FG95_9CREN|nr:phosphoribosyltransferase family protein [Infirmifilum lucidum]QOJ78641.1 phosphoribosyltransferase [Infirmifilum lucidum]